MSRAADWEEGEPESQKPRELDAAVPDEQRRSALEALYESNVAAQRAPYAEVELRTLGEVDWIIEQRNWRGEASRHDECRVNLQGAVLRRTRLDNMYLRNAVFEDADLFYGVLAGAYLEGAQFRRATLERGDLSGAILERADLREATLRRTSLENVYAVRANLRSANLNRANLRDANLTRADLRGADCRSADMRGTVLVGVQMDEQTDLTNVVVDRRTKLGDIDWTDVRLAGVRWREAPTLGDEPNFRRKRVKGYMYGRTSRERAAACRKAQRAYHALEVALRHQGLTTAASSYRLDERRMERKALYYEHRYGAWFLFAMLNLIAGYGERPARAVLAYLNVIAFFMDAYLFVTRLGNTRLMALNWHQALVLSVISFHGRGFFEPVPVLGDWVSIVAALEAAVGLVIEIMFIVTFTRRFLGG